MVRRLILSIAVLWAVALPNAASASDPNAVFAAHDPYGRLPYTEFRELGAVQVQEVIYTIYYLTFVNPISHHGQQRIAVIRNGNQFAGAYQCLLGEGGARLVIGKDKLTVYQGDLSFVIQFDEQGPSRNEYFCGEGSGWEDSI